MKRIILLAAASAPLLAAALDGASPYGVCSHVTRDGFSYRDESCRRIADSGIGAVRSDVDWKRCQPEKGAPFDFSFYDAAVESAERAGLRFLPILFRPPKWASPVWKHLDEWGAFVEAFVAHFGKRLPEIEIWNEQNLFAFWGGEPDAARYVEVLRAAFEASRRANPEVRVLLGGVNGVPLPYLRRVYENGGAPFFDALCFHPYCHPYAPEGAMDSDIEALRELMAEFGDAAKPLVITELGWPTHDVGAEWAPMLRTALAAAHPERKAWRVVYAAAAPGAGGEPPHAVAAAIKAALPPGSTAEACFGERLRERLAAGDVDAVVYPFDETFPVDTFEDVFAFVKAGGTLVDFGGMPAWYPYREVSPGRFVKEGEGETVAALRARLRLSLDAFWLNPALPRFLKALPTPEARAAGYKGDPAGERAGRFQTPRALAPGDEWTPLLVGKDEKGGDAVAASLIRYGGADGLTGCVAVSGVLKRGKQATIDETAQARYLSRALALSLAEGVESFYWYEFRATELDPFYSEHHYGLVHSDFAPKPALGAYFTFVRERPAGSVQSPGPWRDASRTFFFPQWTRPDGTAAGVVWSLGETAPRTLRFGGDGVLFRDFTGRALAPAREAPGVYSVPVGENPVFFSGAPLLPD